MICDANVVRVVAYLGYVTRHGRHFDGGAKLAWQQLKILFIVLCPTQP